MKPLAIDICAGLGGWTDGLLAEGWDVIGFDIERHQYWVPDNPEGDGHKGTKPIEKRGWTQGCAISLGMESIGRRPATKLLRYPAQLVLQDVLTLHGSQFRNVDLIVASPPCQFFSYTAMPWTRAKKLAADVRADPARLEKELALFNACFRIQREACEVAGRHIPMVVENVRGAIPWVGRSRWNFGSFHLWGDVPALMPMILARSVGGSRFNIAHNTTSGVGNNPDRRKGIPHRTAGHWTNPAEHEGVKQGGDWFNSEQPSIVRLAGSKSPARKAASAMIAKIPEPLSRYIARVFKPVHITHRNAA